MRFAVKYSMDGVQDAIVLVINSLPSDSGIARLAFMAEFPGHFYKSSFKEVFVQACSTDRRPSGHDLQPLMAFPYLVALMMQYREENLQPNRAIRNEMASLQYPFRYGISSVGESYEDSWLDRQLNHVGLEPFLAEPDSDEYDL